MFRLSRAALVLVPALALPLAGAGAAAAKKADPTKMTCEEFVSLDDGEQENAAAFLEGWNHGKKKVEIGEVGVDRDVTTLVASCTEQPKESLWRRFEKHVPVLKNHLKPIPMVCTDYIGLSESVQPELYYYLDGYNRATRTTTDVAGEIDLEKDYQSFVQVCKQAPKESLWEKIKASFKK